MKQGLQFLEKEKLSMWNKQREKRNNGDDSPSYNHTSKNTIQTTPIPVQISAKQSCDLSLKKSSQTEQWR